jgi:hypothetical protein
MTALSLEHQILCPYTAFVGVETDGPVQNNTLSKVRYIPIQLSKDSKYQAPFQSMAYSSYGNAQNAYSPQGMAYGFAAMRPMKKMPQSMAPGSFSGHGHYMWSQSR